MSRDRDECTKERGIFERPKGSGIWYVRYKDQHGKLFRERVGPKGLAKKVYQKRRTEIEERRFFPEQFEQRDEPLAPAFTKYVEGRTDLDPSWKSVSKWWLAQDEVKKRSVREFSPEDVEEVRRQTVAAGRLPSTWNKRLALLHVSDRVKRPPVVVA